MYLGVDLGTSSLKATVIDDSHQVRAAAEVALQVIHSGDHQKEQDPRQWEAALEHACSQLAVQIPLNQIERVGLTGQMHGATCVDESGRVLRPCILWNDGRSYAECEQLNQLGTTFTDRSGNLAMPGFTAPKLMWLRAHEPEIYHKIRKVLLPKDYLRLVLTGDYATDPSDASGTLWLNPETRQWDAALMEMTGADPDWMPSIMEGPEESGQISAQASKRFGLPRARVVSGGGDNACGALALGMTKPNQAFISIGTSGVFFVVSDRHQACPSQTVHAFAHALPNTWHQMTVTLSAAHALAWLSDVLGQSVDGLVHRVSVSHRTETDVLFLPYLNGERSPHNDPEIRGSFLHVSATTTAEDLCLAVMEGVAFSFCDGLSALRHANASIQSALSIGGGAQSKYWLQIFANALEIPVETSEASSIGPSLGAARLAMHDQDLAYPMEHITDRLIPNSTRQDYYQSKLAGYRQAYAAIRNIPRSSLKGQMR